MPNPVDALPCGSRSMISTCSPIAASAVPRLMAVVVLPTPPFWLARASTRNGDWESTSGELLSASFMAMGPITTGSVPFRLPDHHDPTLRTGPAGHQLCSDHPMFGRPGQFQLDIATLEKEACGTFFQQRSRVFQQSVERRQCARRDGISRLAKCRIKIIDSLGVHKSRNRQFTCGLPQEGGF